MIVIAIFAFIAVSVSNVSSTKEVINTPPICEPGVLEEMPQHIKKVCVALENSNQLSTALNAYIRSEAAGKLKIFFFFFGNISDFELHSLTQLICIEPKIWRHQIHQLVNEPMLIMFS